tara:strand:- start:41 stop:538 length:498 start_codon:yes stop_codon:yes gene_type:complete
MLGLGLGIPHQSMLGEHEIGDTYQGGLIFYLDGSGGGLICSADVETTSTWGCSGTTITGADGTAIGTGAQNTIDINAGCTTANTAADRCRDKTTGGFTDWFLPSKDELNQLYVNKSILPAFQPTGFYWSSTEDSHTNAWRQQFSSGSQATLSKGNTVNVRAIRAF